MKKKLLCLIMTLMMIIPCFASMVHAEHTDYIISSEGIMPFKDIEDTHWYYDAAIFCYANGIVKGQGNEYTFAPNAELTRATFTVMLARILEADLSEYENRTRFSDCTVGSWYTASVEWAADNGYVLGTNAQGTTFSPNAIINREQCSTMLYRVIDKMGIAVSVPEGVLDTYIDKDDISNWALDGVSLMVDKGIMKGGIKKDFMPKTAMTRAQIAVVTMNVLKTIVNGDCEHEFVEATCTVGKICVICEMAESIPNGHYCETLSCNESGVCITCGEEVAADAALHAYSPATCTLPKTCRVCKATEGSALGHNYSKATCTAPGKCTRCNTVSTAALGHTTKFGICSRCNGEVFASKFLRCAYYMAEKGDPNGKGQYAAYTYYDYGNSEYDIGILYYDATKTEFGFGYSYFWSDGTHLSVSIDIPKNSSSYEYEIGYFDANENEISSGTGRITPTGTTANYASFAISSHSGSNKYWSWLDSCTEDMLLSCIYYNDFILDYLCGESVSAFNFTSFEY